MRSPFRWLRTRNAAIASRRTDHAARTKGGLFAKDQTPDAAEPALCLERWRHEDETNIKPHWCVLTGEHETHLCFCGALVEERHLEAHDDLTALAANVDVDPQPTYREQVCGLRWDRDPDVDYLHDKHEVAHLCVITGEHLNHCCLCGAWRLEPIKREVAG